MENSKDGRMPRGMMKMDRSWAGWFENMVTKMTDVSLPMANGVMTDREDLAGSFTLPRESMTKGRKWVAARRTTASIMSSGGRWV